MLKVRSFFPQSNKKSIGIDNISRDKQYQSKFNNSLSKFGQKFNNTINGGFGKNTKYLLSPRKSSNVFNNLNDYTNYQYNKQNSLQHCSNIDMKKYNKLINIPYQTQHQPFNNNNNINNDSQQQQTIQLPQKKLTISLPNTLKIRNSQRKRQSLLQSYDFIFEQQKQKQILRINKINKNKMNSSNKFNTTMMKSIINNQTQLKSAKLPMFNYDFTQSRISASLNLTNSRTSFLKKIDEFTSNLTDSASSSVNYLDKQSIFHKKYSNSSKNDQKKVRTYEVNRKLKRLKQNIELDKILQSSNLMNIYNQLYQSYEAVPFDENQLLIKKMEQEQQQAKRLQEKRLQEERALKEKTQKKFKVYQMKLIKNQNKTLKGELKELTKDTEQIISAQAKQLKEFIRN